MKTARIITAIILSIVISTVNANTINHKKRKIRTSYNTEVVSFSIGYGIPNYGKLLLKNLDYGFLGNDITVENTFGYGPIHAKAAYRINKKIDVGLSVNYSSYGVELSKDTLVLPDIFTVNAVNNFTSYDYNFTKTSISVLARMNFHFLQKKNVDPYFGFGLGYRTDNWSFKTNDPEIQKVDISTTFSFPVAVEATIGCKYFFTPNIGVYGEFGLAKSLFQTGVSVKF